MTLDLRTEVNLGSWTQLPATGPGSLRNTAPVTITRGRPDNKASFNPTTAGFTLDNRDGRWTIRNPNGTWYGKLVQDTPIRFSLPASLAGLSNYLRFEGDLTSSVTTPDKAALQITGPIDIRVDCLPSDYSGNVLAAKWGGTAQSWLFTLDTLNLHHPPSTTPLNVQQVATGTLGWYWFDGANTQFLRANALLPYYGQRICLRVLFTPSTGTAQFFTAPTMAGPFTQLGTSQVFGATTLSSGVGQAVQVGGGPIIPFTLAQDSLQLTFNSFLGMVYEAQILSNVTLEADPVFSSQAAGATSFTDAQSNVWTLGGTSEISSRLYRFHGELAALPKQATPNSADAYVSAQAGGITRRLQQAQTPLNSPMYRAYVRLPASLNLGAYWPGEDGSTATSIGSGIGGPPMQISGSPKLASNSDFASSAPLPVMNGATFTGRIPSWPGGNDVDVRFLWEVPAGGETDLAIVAAITYTGGTVGYMTVTYRAGGSVSMEAYTAPGGTLIHATGPVVLISNGGKFRFAADLKKNGTGVDMTMASLQPNATAASVSTFTIASATVGQPTSVQFGSAGITGSVLGHFSVQGTADSIFDIAGALNAWLGEPAATRVSRLCSEEGIACRIIGPQAASIAMGTQTIQTFMSLLQECEATDQGMLFEPRQALGIGYVTQRALCGQPAMATVAFGGNVDPAFSPASDDTLVINDVTMTAAGGTTSRQVLSTGPMSTAAPPSGVGRFDTTVPVNPSAAQSLDDLASWYLHIHTADEDRYPSIPFQLARSGAQQAIPLLDIGSYLSVTAVPSWVPPPPVRQLVAGYTETIGPQPLWSIAFNGIPEAPYETAFADSSRAQTPGSTVHANTASGSGTFQADSSSDLWTTAAGDYPFDLLIAGQRITVSACSGSSSPQTFTVSAWGVNGVTKNLVAGDKILVYQRPWAGLT